MSDDISKVARWEKVCIVCYYVQRRGECKYKFSFKN